MKSTEFQIDVVAANDDDTTRTAALHVSELPHGLFPRLGEIFVRRWHRANLRSAHGVVLVATRDDEVVGFVLGTLDRHANVAWIIQHHRRELIVAAARAMVRRPSVAAHFVRTRGVRYGRRLLGAVPSTRVADPGAVPEAEFSPAAVLEAVVVDPAARGRGVGSALVAAFVAEAADAGLRRVELVTKAGGTGAGGFYERAGWHQVGGHVDRDGDQVLTYRIDPRVAVSR